MVTLEIDQNALHSFREDANAAARLFGNPRPAGNGSDRWGVDGNTIRAYRGFDKPLRHYNQWGEECSNAFLEGQHDGADFSHIHGALTNSLRQHWQTQGDGLSIAQTYKLVDLFILRMSYFKPLQEDIRALLQNDGHPALDKFTLSGLAKMVPGLVIGSLSMGAIESEPQYGALQSVIRQITAQAQVPNLNFDIWCWPTKRRLAFGLTPR